MTAQSSEDQSPSAGEYARDEIQQPPTQGEIEGLVERLRSLRLDSYLERLVNDAASFLLALQAQVQRGEEEKAYAAELLQAYVAQCNAEWVTERDARLAAEQERDEARKHLNSEYHARKAAEARLASLREEVERSSSVSLPAHVADATATEGQHSAGWVLVPREPTEAMLSVEVVRDSGGRVYGYSEADLLQRARRDIWRAMLTAALDPPAKVEGEGSSGAESAAQRNPEALAPREAAPTGLSDPERHELECLRHQVGQLEYPCSPHCEGYLRELAMRNGGRRAPREAGVNLDEPYRPVAIHWEAPDYLEHVQRDVPTFARPVAANLDVLLTIAEREPIGWRIYGWSRIAPASSTPPSSLGGGHDD